MQKKQGGNAQAALALVATVVGAGFASGREVIRFFSFFGAWSWVGCAVAAAALAGFSCWAATLASRLEAYDLYTLCHRALGGWGGHAAALINTALITVTAGAMIAAMGELCALALPVRHAYWIGIAASVILAGLMAVRGLSAIAAIGGWLLPACLLLYGLLLRQPAPSVPYGTPPGAWRALPLALAYASMNAALGCGVLCELGRGREKRQIVRTCIMAGGMLLALLWGANAALSRHTGDLYDEALPIVVLSRSLGATGYWLCIAVLSLAVMTTLVAMIRTLQRMLGTKLPSRASWGAAFVLPLLTGLTGFTALVGSVYPLLGAASTLLFIAIILKPLKFCSQVSHKRVVYSLCRGANSKILRHKGIPQESLPPNENEGGAPHDRNARQ